MVAVFGRHWARAARDARFGMAGGTVRREAIARATRRALEELGPAFVKLGQLISVRPDLFPPELVFELTALQASAEPVPFERIRPVVEAELGGRIEGLYETFEREPLAAGSVAQVHRATLREASRPAWGPPLPAGADVAVKVLRPGVRARMEEDLDLAHGLLASRTVRRLLGGDLSGLVAEFRENLDRETDMRAEGRTADRFAFDFRDDEVVVVPRVVWTRTSRRVLTMEFLEGWRLSELDEAGRSGIDARRLARHGARAFMRQVLVHGRYHADLHPANLYVTPDERIAYLDFGIVGELDRERRRHVAQVLAATVYRDPARAIRYSAELGMTIPPEDRERVVADVERLMDRTLAADGDVRRYATGFLGLMREHGIDVPLGYGLLVKSLVTVEGVARALYPDVDLVETARPFVTELLLEHYADPERIYRRAPRAVRAALLELVR